MLATTQSIDAWAKDAIPWTTHARLFVALSSDYQREPSLPSGASGKGSCFLTAQGPNIIRERISGTITPAGARRQASIGPQLCQ